MLFISSPHWWQLREEEQSEIVLELRAIHFRVEQRGIESVYGTDSRLFGIRPCPVAEAGKPQKSIGKRAFAVAIKFQSWTYRVISPKSAEFVAFLPLLSLFLDNEVIWGL